MPDMQMFFTPKLLVNKYTLSLSKRVPCARRLFEKRPVIPIRGVIRDTGNLDLLAKHLTLDTPDRQNRFCMLRQPCS